MTLFLAYIVLFFGIAWASSGQDDETGIVLEIKYIDDKIFDKYIHFNSLFVKNKQIGIQNPEFLEDLSKLGIFLEGYLKKFPIKCLTMLKNYPFFSFSIFFWKLIDMLSLKIPKEQWVLEELFDIKPRKTISDLLDGHIYMCGPMLNHIKEMLFRTFTGSFGKTKAFKVVRMLHETIESIVIYADRHNLTDDRFKRLQELVSLDRYVMKNAAYDYANRTIDSYSFVFTFEKIIQYAILEGSNPHKDAELKGLLTLFTIYAHLCYSNKRVAFSKFPLNRDVEILFFIIEVWSLGEKGIDQMQIFTQFKRFYLGNMGEKMMLEEVDKFNERFNTNKKRNRDSSRRMTISDIAKDAEGHLNPENLWLLNALAVIENPLVD